MKLFGILIISLSFVCCNRNEVKKELSALMAKKITIPENGIISINGKDTVIENYYNAKYKIIVYADILGCNPCKVSKMSYWIDMIKFVNSCDETKIYFIFSVKQSELHSLKISLMSYPIDYPVIIYKNNEFSELNTHIPKAEHFHTFLLDENNQVILTGNPIYNDEIKQMYLNKIHEIQKKFNQIKYK